MDIIDGLKNIAPGALPEKTLVSEKIETKRNGSGGFKYLPRPKPPAPPDTAAADEEQTEEKHHVDIVV
ncbi:MAG: hypothetical protein FJ128_03735 [Deltaproteobacteria bacterium]|nr:hypothetical protein [Deltaproteobacteria bacterium]